MENKIKTNLIPVTGKENMGNLTEPFQALVQFYRAFNNRDLTLMSDNWEQSEEIAMDNPVGGIRRGWAEIKEVYEKIFNGPARVYVEFYDYTIHRGKDMFYAVGRERGEFSIGNKKVNLAIRTSRIFKFFGGKWKQVHHHGSIDNPELLKEYQQAVLRKD
jgi:ketosteroid isomerase-like protein